MGFNKFSLVELSTHILKISFHDPASANSFGSEAAKELAQINRKLSSPNSQIKVIIFTGTDRFFCSGGNLKEYRKLRDKISGIKINLQISKVLKNFMSLPVAKIAVVNGDCYGGGIELLSCFDFIHIQPQALFGFWQSRQSLTFGWGGFSRLTTRILPIHIQNFLLRSQTISAYEAVQIGLADRVFSRFEIMPATLHFAAQLVTNAENYSVTRRLSGQNELKSFSKLWWSATHRERLFKL